MGYFVRKHDIMRQAWIKIQKRSHCHVQTDGNNRAFEALDSYDKVRRGDSKEYDKSTQLLYFIVMYYEQNVYYPNKRS